MLGDEVTPLTFTQFMNGVSDNSIAMRHRKGQALFNELTRLKPEFAESIRGTAMDPFFVTEKDIKYKECVKYLKEHWGNIK